jgi:glycerol-1-phosphate dehydrogenase [NAD(P)+]
MASVDYWVIEYGGIAKSFEGISNYGVFSVEPPWSKCRALFPSPPRFVELVSDVEVDHLRGLTNRLITPEYVVGVGGGIAMDAAKFYAIKTGAKLISVPTVLSVVAYLTPKAAVRRHGVVSFVGDKFPDLIVIDFPTIRSAPTRLNIAGCGDLYCASVALLDWKLARDRRNEEYDPEVVRKSYELIAQIREHSNEIKHVTDEGLRTMIQVGMGFFRLHRPYEVKNKLWPDQGIEHVFFYSLEKVTGRSFIHGEVIGIGCVVGAYIHQSDIRSVMKDLDSFGLIFRPRELGITRSEFASTIRDMKKVGKEAGFTYDILDEFSPQETDIENLWSALS